LLPASPRIGTICWRDSVVDLCQQLAYIIA
jgi:hypothetical protein